MDGMDGKPTAGQMSRFVFKEALQHPTTIFPAAATLVSALYLYLINFNRQGFAFLLGAGVLTSLSFVWHYFFRFEKIVGKLFRAKKVARFDNLADKEKDLYRRCTKSGFHEGASELRQLAAAFEKLRDYLLDDHGTHNRPQAERFLVIASEAFKEGMSCLEAALAAHVTMKRVNLHTLRTEMVAWTAERHRLSRQGEKNKVKMQALTTKIDSHRQRISLYQQQSDQLAEYMAQAEVIEAALETTYFEVSQLMNRKSPVIGTDSVSQLEKAVAAAQRVEAKLRAMEQPDTDADAVYLEAGRQSND